MVDRAKSLFATGSGSSIVRLRRTRLGAALKALRRISAVLDP
jgi:hypothetical protein